MYFVKINGEVQEFIFDTKRDCLVYIVDTMKREEFEDPIAILKSSKKIDSGDEHSLITKNKTYKIFKMYKYEKCCVCEEAMKSKDSLKCSHFVCIDCLGNMRKNECPVCRKELNGEIITDEIFSKILQNTEIDEAENEDHQHLLAFLSSLGINVNEIY